MKLLKYFGFTVLVLILLFFSIGFFKPVVSYGHTIEVNKPIEEAWAVQQDVTKLNQWLKGFKSIDLIEGEAGTVGSKYKVVVKPEPDQPDFIMIETVEGFKVNDHISLRFDSDFMAFYQTTSFSERDGITTITSDSKVHGNGIVWKSMFALMEMLTGTFQAQEEENFENLKQVIEQNTTNYFTASQSVE